MRGFQRLSDLLEGAALNREFATEFQRQGYDQFRDFDRKRRQAELAQFEADMAAQQIESAKRRGAFGGKLAGDILGGSMYALRSDAARNNMSVEDLLRERFPSYDFPKPVF